MTERAQTTAVKDAVGARSAARLASVQALYQMSVTEIGPKQAIGEFVEHRFGREIEGLLYEGVDRPFFEDIVMGVADRRDEIDAAIDSALDKERKVARLERILAAVLRAGVYELMARLDVPGRVVISEYVDVARVFFEGPQPGFVNGVLDRLAKELRAGELGVSSTQKGAA